MNVGILGAGNWGTTFGLLADRSGHRVALWEFDVKQAERVAASRENAKFLPGYPIPESIVVTSDIGRAADAEVLVLAVPAQSCRQVLRQIGGTGASTIVVSLVKGIEQESLACISQVCGQELNGFESGQFAVLSGPTIAPEVASRLPASATVASSRPESARQIQTAFSSPDFRLYTSDDVIGVEFAGALKNVIALAAGMCDGMRLGYNSKGALVTRGLTEITRLGELLGGKRHTFTGLSGLGDLVTTCSAPQSRNRTVGERIGAGESLEEVLSTMAMVAEGVWTSRAASVLAHQHGVSAPITDAVCRVLFEHQSPREALGDLMQRALKAED